MRSIHLRVAVGVVGALLALGATLAVSSLGQDNVPLIWDGHLILRIRVGSGGLTSAERASEIQMRLEDLMADQFANERADIIGRIAVHKYGKELTIGTPDRLLMTVTLADARACNSTVFWLAQYWRARIIEAMIIATRTG